MSRQIIRDLRKKKLGMTSLHSKPWLLYYLCGQIRSTSMIYPNFIEIVKFNDLYGKIVRRRDQQSI